MSSECEIIDWSTKLSTLKEKGLISEVEYQAVVCNGSLIERSLLKLLFTKYQLQGANILKLFEVLTEEMPVAANDEDNKRLQHYDGGKNQQGIHPLYEKNKNPLLINTVIRSVFQFLTFEEIKEYRLVCHQWDSTAQPFLRRRGIIHFRPKSLKPSTFLNLVEDHLPELPFTSFEFSNVGSSRLWSVSQLQIFFDKCAGNVKHLELFNICLRNQSHCYDVTPWVEMATNLTKLTIRCSGDSQRLNGCPDMYTPLQVELGKLKSVKYLHLNGQGILISLSSGNRIAPLEVTLNDVRFKKTELGLVRLNNYIDFSQAKNIILTPYANKNTYCAIFDMDTHAFKADNVCLKNIDIQNWNKAKGQIDCLTVFKMRLIEKNDLEINKFVLSSCTIDMVIIPLTIEQIHFVNKRTRIICDHSIVLPKLVFLGFKNVTQHALDMLSRFAYCKNLVEIEIEKQSDNLDSQLSQLILKVSMIPKSVKILKITGSIMLVRGDNGIVRSLEKLIFGETRCDMTNILNFFSELLSATFNLNVKVLVIDVTHWNLNNQTIINFVKANQHFEKIIVGNLENVYKHMPFEGSSFSRSVDSKSYYYEFEKNNAMGKSITKDQFLLWKSFKASTFD